MEYDIHMTFDDFNIKLSGKSNIYILFKDDNYHGIYSSYVLATINNNFDAKIIQVVANHVISSGDIVYVYNNNIYFKKSPHKDAKRFIIE